MKDCRPAMARGRERRHNRRITSTDLPSAMENRDRAKWGLPLVALPDLAETLLDSHFYGLQFRRIEAAEARFQLAGFGLTASAVFVYVFFVGVALPLK